jgi:hypothetical protein
MEARTGRGDLKASEMKTAQSRPVAVNRTEPDRSDRRFIILARILLALSMVMTLVGVVGVAVGSAIGVPVNLKFNVMEAIFGMSQVILPGIVGLFIVSRYPRHTVGWLLLLLSLSFAQFGFLAIFGGIVAYQLTYASNPVIVFLAWTERWLWLAAPIIPLIIIPLYFPDGRLLSRRWRFAAVAAILGLFVGMASYAIDSDAVEIAANFSVPNPYQFGVEPALADVLWQYVATPLLMVGFSCAFASVILRYRRAQGVERAQMKWVLYVIVLSMGLNSVGNFLASISSVLRAVYAKIADPLVQIETIALPITIGIAILRYRLYDIDIIIRKTLIFAVLTSILSAVYFGSVLLAQQMFRTVTGGTPELVIVISTLLIAALFNPLRRGVQDVVDRRFYRRKYNAARTLAAFGAVLRDETDLNQLSRHLVQVVDQTMHPAHLSLWLKSPSGDVHGRG